MTIYFTQPGDVAAQVYNEALSAGFSHKGSVEHSWNAMQQAKELEKDEASPAKTVSSSDYSASK